MFELSFSSSVTGMAFTKKIIVYCIYKDKVSLHHSIDIVEFSIRLLTSPCTYCITRNRDNDRVSLGKPIHLIILEFSVIFALLQ